jgi:hypothetical protein
MLNEQPKRERVPCVMLGHQIGTMTGWDQEDTWAVIFYEFEPNNLGQDFVPEFNSQEDNHLVVAYDTGQTFARMTNGEERSIVQYWSAFDYISTVVEISDNKDETIPSNPPNPILGGLELRRLEIFEVAGKRFENEVEAKRYFCEFWFHENASKLMDKYKIRQDVAISERMYDMMIKNPRAVIDMLDIYDRNVKNKEG